MARKIGDILGIGLILQSIFIMILSLSIENKLVMLSGFIGGMIVLAIESIFLYDIWIKNV